MTLPIIRPPSPPPAMPTKFNEVPRNEPLSVRHHSIYDSHQAVYDYNFQAIERTKRWSPLKWAFWIVLAIVIIHTLLK